MKKLIAILLALVLALSLCACGGSDTEEASTDTETAETETTEIVETESAEETAEETVEAEEPEEPEEVSEDEPEAAASGEPSGEPAAAPAASGDVPVADENSEYIVELARDDVATADIAVAVGETVEVALNYTGQDSTVDFEVSDPGDTSIVTLEDDLVSVSVTGVAAGSTTATLSWTAVNTSGSTYTVQLNITVS